MRTRPTLAALFVLAAAVHAQEPSTADRAAAHSIQPCTINASDGNGQKECEKRDTALLFLLAGQKEPALRILCNTHVALEVFRPNGPLGTDKYEDNVSANKRCLESVGIK
jgi:hypothetical protein